ncbi:hypothetical protein MKY41_13710 [Sporosarcina sp. FSL W7-1349]
MKGICGNAQIRKAVNAAESADELIRLLNAFNVEMTEREPEVAGFSAV